MKYLGLFWEITHKSACCICVMHLNKNQGTWSVISVWILMLYCLSNFVMHLTKIGVPDPSLVLPVDCCEDRSQLRCRKQQIFLVHDHNSLTISSNTYGFLPPKVVTHRCGRRPQHLWVTDEHISGRRSLQLLVFICHKSGLSLAQMITVYTEEEYMINNEITYYVIMIHCLTSPPWLYIF